MNPDIFISYKREDLALVKTIASALTNQGWNVWWDHDIPAGKDYDTVIQDNITDAKCVIVLWSERSINSRNVKDEANVGLERNVLIPVLIGNVKAPIGFRMIQAVMCSNTNSIDTNVLQEIIHQVKLMIGEPGTGQQNNQAESGKSASKKFLVEEPVTYTPPEVAGNPWHSGNPSGNDLNFKKIIIGISLLACVAFAAYGIMTKYFFAEAEKQSAPVETIKQAPASLSDKIEEPLVAADTFEPEVQKTLPVIPVQKQNTVVAEKPKQKPEPVKEKETVSEPIAEPVKAKPQIRNDLNGRWRADDNRIWIIQQAGNNVTISFCDENGQSCDMAEGRLDGHLLTYNSIRRGKDKKGSFTISDDFKRMNGKTNIAFGLSNRITVTKVD